MESDWKRSTWIGVGPSLLAVFACGWGVALCPGCHLPNPILAGPVERPKVESRPQFPNLYQQWTKPHEAKPPAAPQPRITISAQGMDCGAFCREVARQAGLSIVVGQGLEEKLLTMEIRNQPIDDVLALLARRMDVTMRREGNLYFVGALKPEDKGILVRRVRRVKVDQLSQALAVFAGEHGRSAQFADGLVVVGDTVEVLKRVSEMLDLVESSDAPVWIVQLHLVSYSRQAADELGVNMEPAAKAGLAFATGSLAGTVDSGLSLSASLDAVLQVAFHRDDVSVTAAPMFLLCDGTKAEFVQGDRVPLPRRTVSNQGTVTTAGYDYVQTGVQVELLLREFAEDAARMELMISMSDVKRMVEEAPVTGEERFKTEAIVRAGGVYLLGTLVKDRKQGRQEIGWQSGDYVAQSAQVVQVWGQCYRIGAALSEPAALAGQGVQALDIDRAGPDNNGDVNSEHKERGASLPRVGS